MGRAADWLTKDQAQPPAAAGQISATQHPERHLVLQANINAIKCCTALRGCAAPAAASLGQPGGPTPVQRQVAQLGCACHQTGALSQQRPGPCQPQGTGCRTPLPQPRTSSIVAAPLNSCTLAVAAVGEGCAAADAPHVGCRIEAGVARRTAAVGGGRWAPRAPNPLVSIAPGRPLMQSPPLTSLLLQHLQDSSAACLGCGAGGCGAGSGQRRGCGRRRAAGGAPGAVAAARQAAPRLPGIACMSPSSGVAVQAGR